MRNRKFICFFKFKGDVYETDIGSLLPAKSGFWVDGGIEYCEPSRGVYWIPPHSIMHIELKEYMVIESEVR